MTDVYMPQMGESIAEGTIVKWFKEVGQPVKKDEPLFEMSTDKVDAEIPSPVEGVLLEILAGPGVTVEVGKKVGRIGAAGAAPVGAPAQVPVAAAVATPAREMVAARSGGNSGAIPSVEELRRVRSSPLVRKIAAEHGVDLARVGPGSGVSGRVTKQDILTFLERKPEVPPAAAAVQSVPARYLHTPLPGQRSEPFSPMREKIAEHMVMSQAISAHVCTFFEVDMTRVARLRSKHKAAYESKGVKLTYTPFVMKAVVDALNEFPLLNSSVVDKRIYYHPSINLGMAVALDWGLIVPVVHRAEEKSLLGLTRALADLAERARLKKLAPEEVQGGTFTITNPGIYGSLVGTPVINQPQVAILGMGAVTKRPVVTEEDAIAIRHMVSMALSFDHRIIDGATA
ncbi:2-oxo acid dehydrogenase subunit E2, partial [bacterium CPR1]|nr:2-oxo acid dehydrogenase subunit E2 [bacterium CPR1]